MYNATDTHIKNVRAMQIFDSRGKPTVRAEVTLACGAMGDACCPSGASTGSREAHELRDGDKEYGGKGVAKAVNSVNTEINTLLRNMDAAEQSVIDGAMCSLDGTDDKSRLGANAILAVSLAAARAAASAYGMPLYRWLGGVNAHILPRPMMNILNGGAHAGNNLDIQEFMIIPQSECFADNMRMAVEIYRTLGGILREKKLSTGVGDEGGFAPDLESDEAALELIIEAIERAGYKPGQQVALGLDAAATEWQTGDGGSSTYRKPKQGTELSRSQLVDYFDGLCLKYPIISIEDPLGEEDFDGFSILSDRVKGVQIVGDDLFVTDVERLRQGIARRAGNAILIKPNQTGTLTGTLEAVSLAQRSGWATVISHRSGETADTFIADLAVGLNAGQIKTGAPCRSERVEKYNRLLQIHRDICGHK